MAPLVQLWPNPALLEGVKSRKKPIFKADKAIVTSGTGSNWNASGIALCLESRIVAIGEGANCVVDLLLGKQSQESGTVSRHEALVVAHLGPHLAGQNAGVERHAAAVAAALGKKPQVVVLDEALSHGGAGWAKAFQQLIRDPSLMSFKGAVIVLCSFQATFAMRRLCSEQWLSSNGQVLQQDASSQRFQIVEDALSETLTDAPVAVKKGRGRSQNVPKHQLLLDEARALSEWCFEEDVVSLAHKEGWTVSFLTEEVHDGSVSLRGFLCYRSIHTNTCKELHIERLAVPKQERGRGFARMLMQWVLGEAARMPLCDCASIQCSSVRKAIPFYEKFGFATTGTEDKDELTPMQLRNQSLVCNSFESQVSCVDSPSKTEDACAESTQC
jgi:GNAT superfamily N-acetyltransferase